MIIFVNNDNNNFTYQNVTLIFYSIVYRKSVLRPPVISGKLVIDCLNLNSDLLQYIGQLLPLPPTHH